MTTEDIDYAKTQIARANQLEKQIELLGEFEQAAANIGLRFSTCKGKFGDESSDLLNSAAEEGAHALREKLHRELMGMSFKRPEVEVLRTGPV